MEQEQKARVYVRNWLFIREIDFITQKQFDELSTEIEELINLYLEKKGFIRYED